MRVVPVPAVASTIYVNSIPRNDGRIDALELQPDLYSLSFDKVTGFFLPTTLSVRTCDASGCGSFVSQPLAQTVSVVAGRTTEIQAAFTPASLLRATTSGVPAGSNPTISIDGQPANDGSVSVSLPAGNHTVSFQDLGLPGTTTPCSQTMTLATGASASVNGDYGTGACGTATPTPTPTLTSTPPPSLTPTPTQTGTAIQTSTPTSTPNPNSGRVTRRTTATLAGAQRTATQLITPAGVQDGDVMILQLYTELQPNSPVSMPPGWLEIPGSPVVTNQNTMRYYYKVASSEPASWTWTHASTFTGINFGAWAGGDPTSPIYPPDGITATKAAVNNTNNVVTAQNFNMPRTGSMLIGGGSTVNGRSLADHHGFFTVASWGGPNGTELDEMAGPWDGIVHHTPVGPWLAGDSSGATNGSRFYTYDGKDYLTIATFAIQPPAH